MIIRLTTLLCLVVPALLNAAPVVAQFTIKNRPVKIFKFNEHNQWLSQDCVSGERPNHAGDKTCDALKSLKSVSIKSIEKVNPEGGASPGALICSLVLKHALVTGLDDDENENQFCLYPDGSMVSTGSLTHWAYKNEGLR